MTQPIQIYIGSDHSQALASKVLEHSIRRHSDREIEVTHMIDLPVTMPRDPDNRPRTGFSFSRFQIPALAGYTGRAIYLDADMLVFKDIGALWDLPMHGATVAIQQEIPGLASTMHKRHAPERRPLQCSVMLLDCGRLDWDIEAIVARMDAGEFGYAQLLEQLVIVDEDKIARTVPGTWNSLEHWTEDTCLLHYTDMGTQPWVSNRNPLGELWFSEVRLMLDTGALDATELLDSIQAGYFRPSLMADLRWHHRLPDPCRPIWNALQRRRDRRAGYRKHRVVNEERRLRLAAARDDKRGPGSGVSA